MALGAGPGRVQLEELLGQVVDGLLDPLLRAQPVGAAQPAEGRVLAARVAADPGDLLHRDVDPVAAGEAQLEVVTFLAGSAAPEHLLVAGDAVVDVDDEVARLEPLEDVARDHPPERLGPPNADRAEQLPVGDHHQAVGTAAEAAVQAALDQGHRAGRRRGGQPARDPGRLAGFRQQLGETGRLVRGEDDPGAFRAPGFEGLRQAAGTSRRHDRLAPAEEVAARQAPGGHRRARGLARLRLPGQLEGPRPDQAALPVARPQVRDRPVLGQLAGGDQLGPALVGLAPQELGRLGQVARLVQDDQGLGRDVVEPGGRADDPGPDLGRIAGVERPPPFAARGCQVRLRPGVLEPGEVGLRRSGSAALPRPARITSTPPAGMRNSVAGRSSIESIRSVVRWSVGSKLRSESTSSPNSSIRTGRAEPGGKTSTIPPRRANSPRPATDDRLVAQTEQLEQESIEDEPIAGHEAAGLRGQIGRLRVCWRSAWTLATITRAFPLRQAASAATRAAVSSGTSSLRS